MSFLSKHVCDHFWPISLQYFGPLSSNFCILGRLYYIYKKAQPWSLGDTKSPLCKKILFNTHMHLEVKFSVKVFSRSLGKFWNKWHLTLLKYRSPSFSSCCQILINSKVISLHLFLSLLYFLLPQVDYLKYCGSLK